jgi:hypothetical protein
VLPMFLHYSVEVRSTKTESADGGPAWAGVGMKPGSGPGIQIQRKRTVAQCRNKDGQDSLRRLSSCLRLLARLGTLRGDFFHVEAQLIS